MQMAVQAMRCSSIGALRVVPQPGSAAVRRFASPGFSWPPPRLLQPAQRPIAKKQKRLIKAGYFTKKGAFGFVKKNKTQRKSRKNRK